MVWALSRPNKSKEKKKKKILSCISNNQFNFCHCQNLLLTKLKRLREFNKQQISYLFFIIIKSILDCINLWCQPQKGASTSNNNTFLNSCLDNYKFFKFPLVSLMCKRPDVTKLNRDIIYKDLVLWIVLPLLHSEHLRLSVSFLSALSQFVLQPSNIQEKVNTNEFPLVLHCNPNYLQVFRNQSI